MYASGVIAVISTLSATAADLSSASTSSRAKERLAHEIQLAAAGTPIGFRDDVHLSAFGYCHGIVASVMMQSSFHFGPGRLPSTSELFRSPVISCEADIEKGAGFTST